MKEILDYFRQGRDYQNVAGALENNIKEQLVAGLHGSARTMFMSALFTDFRKPVLVVTHNLYQAQKLYEDLVEWLGEEHVLLYPVNEWISSEIATSSPELRRQRLLVLNELTQGAKKVVVSPLAGMKRILPPPSIWRRAQFSLQVDGELDVQHMGQQLLYMGYKRVDLVETEGEYSIRGGIVDLFPAGSELPVRIELFDTDIESIRTFDPGSQRSRETLQEITIGPAMEWVLDAEQYQRAREEVGKILNEQLSRTRGALSRQRLQENIGADMEYLEQEVYFPGMYKYVSTFYESTATLLDYFDSRTIILLDEPTRISEVEEQYEREEQEWKTSMLEQGEILPDLVLTCPFSSLKEQMTWRTIYLSLFLRQIPNASPQNVVHFTSKPMQQFHGQFSMLQSEVERWRKSGQFVLFLAGDEQRAERMVRVLGDFGIETRKKGHEKIVRQGTALVSTGLIQAGFELPLHHLVVITEKELFAKGQKKKRTQTQRKVASDNAQRIKSYSELEEGDYVVHINHGIGRYVGIKTLEVEGAHKDYLHLQYAKNDKLYVPVEQIDQVQKYLGSQEEKTPKLYQLGGNEWKKVKRRVKSSVEDIAEHLIKLYAQRESQPGYAFSEDTDMHREFESYFPYQETEDQLRSIEEIKRDMEKARPMDRLLCGDVGYGKTEVAIRAAFKAIMDGKQVAVLVPTTILAQQHFETFKERFDDYAVEIDVLSRFQTRKAQNETLKKLKKGLIDIVIGTHRLLSKDILFSDLGLLVVDEEQRFGVTHKEKIKQLKHNVDVLTLTATPIPRTLHMSMLGVRDLSVIETPPENRFPVQTYVLEYQGALIREAIERELARGGQVYFLYNEVQGIEQKAEEVRALVPDARVAVAHGQMKESELESVMISFLEGEFDVLVSTTIIESGVDIPNVNTLVIHNADKMGLSQLYQLRGRVGRSSRTAYAYFTYQRGKVLTEVAEKRLQAIKEFTELGSGFKIAMRDLAIRGAGNLLGAEQHGFINSVGFDLYSQMLKEAIEEIKGEKKEVEKVELEVDMHIDAYLPEDYIEDGKQKIEMYKKVAAIRSLEECTELSREMQDRYGPLPPPVQRLLQLSRIKVYASQLKLESMVLKNQVLKMMFASSQNDKIDGGRLFQLVSKFGRHVGLISDTQIGISFKVKGMSEERWLEQVHNLLMQLIETEVTEGVKQDDEQQTKEDEQIPKQAL